MSGEYLLNWTDDGTFIPEKTPLVLTVNTKDTTRTPITLVGKGTPNYGEQLLENMLHILEHFASPEEPEVKTVGMLWYNHGPSKTDLKAGTNAAPLPFQTRDKSLNYYDGDKWVEVVTKEDIVRLFAEFAASSSAKFTAINQTKTKNGDLKIDDYGRIFLKSKDNWRCVWPTTESDVCIDTKSIDKFIGVNSSTADTTNSRKCLGSLYGVGFGDVGYGQTRYPLILQNADYKTTVVERAYILNAANAIIDIARFMNETHLEQRATAVVEYLNSTAYNFFPIANVDIFNSDVLSTLYDARSVSDFGRRQSLSSQIQLSGPNGVVYPSSVSTQPMTVRRLIAGDFVATAAINFSSSDAARYFFNTGGQIRTGLSLSPAEAVINPTIATLLSEKFGTISIGAHSTHTSADRMKKMPINSFTGEMTYETSSYGYYELPVWSGSVSDLGACIASSSSSSGFEMFNTIDVRVYACYTGSTVNGAKGSTIRLSVEITHYEFNPSSGYGYGAGISGVTGTTSQVLSMDGVISNPGVTMKTSVVKASNPFSIETPSINFTRNFA